MKDDNQETTSKKEGTIFFYKSVVHKSDGFRPAQEMPHVVPQFHSCKVILKLKMHWLASLDSCLSVPDI